MCVQHTQKTCIKNSHFKIFLNAQASTDNDDIFTMYKGYVIPNILLVPMKLIQLSLPFHVQITHDKCRTGKCWSYFARTHAVECDR